MFKKSEHKKKGGNALAFMLFRLPLSVAMFLVLIVGAYQAFKYFSGVDPIKIDPKTTALSLLTSEGASQALSALFSFGLPKSMVPKELTGEKITPSETPVPDGPKADSKFIFKFAIVADSHNDNESLAKALQIAKKDGVKFVIGLGDYSDVGTLEELQKAQDVFKASGLPFYVTAGDHDLWDSRDKGSLSISNFNQVFGPTYQSFSDSNIRFVLLFNGDNYEGIDAIQRMWLEDLLTKMKPQDSASSSPGSGINNNPPQQVFVFLHEPLYHPSSDHAMGKVTASLKKQAEDISNMLKNAKVGEVFAGDVHSFGRYQDPKSGLKMTVVGALTSTRNTQAPRFAIVDVYNDGSYNVKDQEIK